MATAGVARRFWERLQREINKQGITQNELVTRSGIPASTINNLKTSTRPPLARIVKDLAGALKIPVDEAMILAGREAPPLQDIDLREAITQSAELSKAGRTALLAMYDALQATHEVSSRLDDSA